MSCFPLLSFGSSATVSGLACLLTRPFGYGEAYREQHGASMSTGQRRVMAAIEVCRTAAPGGHMERREAATRSKR